MHATKFMFFAFAVQLTSMLAILAHAVTSQEVLKCDVYSLGTSIDRDEPKEVRIRALSAQARVRDGQAKLKGGSADVRPLLDGIPQKLFSPDPVPSPIEYEAKLENGKIVIEASATVASGERETFRLAAPDAPERDGEFPGATLRARLKSTLEPEVRFDDNLSRGFEVQCLHMKRNE